MEYIITKTARESDNTKRIEAVLLRPKNTGIKWTESSLHDALVSVGLDYTAEEMKAVVEDLVKRGIIEDTVKPVPVPAEPAPVEPVPPVEPVAPEE